MRHGTRCQDVLHLCRFWGYLGNSNIRWKFFEDFIGSLIKGIKIKIKNSMLLIETIDFTSSKNGFKILNREHEVLKILVLCIANTLYISPL